MQARSRTQVVRVPFLDDLEVMRADMVGFSFPVHFHHTYVLEWVVAGADQCQASGHTACSGQLFAHGVGVAHGGGDVGGAELSYAACYPSRELVAELVGLEVHELPPLTTAVLESRPVRRDAERLFGALATSDSEAVIRESLGSLMQRLFDGSNGGATQVAELHPSVARAHRHLSKHAVRGVSTYELSEVVGLSRFHLLREFKRTYGITPRQFLISERVAQARRLMASGAPLAESAALTGFADQSHMTRAFKAVTAFSPGRVEAWLPDSRPG